MPRKARRHRCPVDGCGREFDTARGVASHRRVHKSAEPSPPPSSGDVPEPPRALQAAGLDLWRRVHADGSTTGVIEGFVILCEQLDERAALRIRVLEHNDPRDRRGLRELDDQIAAGLRSLGLEVHLPHSDEPVDDWTSKLSDER